MTHSNTIHTTGGHVGPILMRAGCMDTNCTEYTFDELQESINYTFTVNQTGFVEGDLSTGPVYAKPYLLN